MESMADHAIHHEMRIPGPDVALARGILANQSLTDTC